MCLNILAKPLISKTYWLTFLISLIFLACFSQNTSTDNLEKSFVEYTQLPRDIVYTHLNKSVYIKGETLAFNAYVFDKNDKRLSKFTTNLYCSIADENGKTIKSKMVLVNEGVANGSFSVDSLFTSGNYVFKAYTNWMKNFDEQNLYIQNIKVIDPEIESNVIPKVISSKLDAQFLPEGGHLLANTENTVGVVIKDELGFGIPNLECQLLNNNNGVINFKTNQFGIGKFMFIPEEGKKYEVSMKFEGKKQIFIIDSAELSGVTLSLGDFYGKVALRISTNKSTLRYIRKQPYKITIHNGFEFKTIFFEFKEDLHVTKYINYDDLSTGINIFTVFNENNSPLLERLFFKYDGINFMHTNEATSKKSLDSMEISLPLKDVDKSLPNHFSISVLPEGTKSYNHHHNIISSTFLQPYVNGFIENATYYFTDISRRKQYELDNLLLTQGWSSYDWNKIFYNPPSSSFEFETGISFKATVNNSKTLKYVMYPSSFNDLEIFEITEGINTFEKKELFPFDDEKIRLSEVKKNDKTKKSSIYLQFNPSTIPDIENYTKILPLKETVFFDSELLQPFLQTSWTEYEQLNEVIIEVDKIQDRIEKLQKSIYGRVDVFDDTKRKNYIDFETYIRTKGYNVFHFNGDFVISKLGGLNRNKSPIVYIDNRLILDYNELSFYNMSIVDYITINETGFGETFRGEGTGGVIKIFTDPTIFNKNNPELSSFQEIDIPLTFETSKTFYTPKYNSYQSRFYKEFGVIKWLPKLSLDENGNISFKIGNQEGPNIKLFIEGTANDGSFISEIKTVNLE
ncbi:hypothetical protein V8G56_06595 [Gaetbulibacter aquiaggeris]|uniref:TonB-dependent receptor plug domain-containing protein n=1 Tax=Gaetbulibacter aquiaggeris TaxID=1735373 RepID=A0ABW7MNJ8_9FLAO